MSGGAWRNQPYFCNRESWWLETGVLLGWTHGDQFDIKQNAQSPACWWVLKPFHKLVSAWAAIYCVSGISLKHTVSLTTTIAWQGRYFEAHFIKMWKWNLGCTGIPPDWLSSLEKKGFNCSLFKGPFLPSSTYTYWMVTVFLGKGDTKTE